MIKAKPRRAKKGKVVFVNGVFDGLNLGHILLLKYAKMQGDSLVVGINSDWSARVIKGDGHPINDQVTRKKAIEALRVADKVVIFDELRVGDVVRRLKPDILVKSSQLSEKRIREIDDLPTDLTIKMFPFVGDGATPSSRKKRTSIKKRK